MDDAHAAQALLVGAAQKVAQRCACFLGAQPVQIHLRLHRPGAAAQRTRHVRADAWTAKTQPVVRFQQAGDVHGIAQRFAQRRRLVQLALARDRCAGQRLQAHRARLGQALHRPHGAAKQVALLRLRLLPLGRAQRLGTGPLGLRRQLHLDLLQIGQ